MWRFVYNLLLHLALPFIWMRLKFRARQVPAYADRVHERFGRVARSAVDKSIWIHTVSAGEVIAAAPLILRIAAAFPNEKILVSTMTVTGYAQVQRLLGEQVEHVYAPYDFPWAVNSFLKVVKPRVLILMETELWPNLMRQLADQGIPVLLINARLSERSHKGYKRIGGLSRPMFASLAWTGCQYPDHARRLENLGVDNLDITGSVKFDLNIPGDLEQDRDLLLSNWKLEGRKVWIAASTHMAEEQLILEAHKKLVKKFPGLLLLLVPRHPERFSAVVAAARKEGFSTGQLTRPPDSEDGLQVLVGDEMGRLMYLYAMADVVFMGGTMSNTGGHNIIEPAGLARAIIAGPSRFNFTEIFSLFESAQAIVTISCLQDIVTEVANLLGSTKNRTEMGRRARQVVQDNAGATERVLENVIPFIEATLDSNTYNRL